MKTKTKLKLKNKSKRKSHWRKQTKNAQENTRRRVVLTKHRVQSNALVRITYGHVEFHQFSVARCTVTVEFGI